MKFNPVQAPAPFSNDKHKKVTFFVLKETDANYSIEVAEYESKLQLVYDDQSYHSTRILYKDFRYLVPIVGGLISIINFILIPINHRMKKQHWQYIVDKMA